MFVDYFGKATYVLSVQKKIYLQLYFLYCIFRHFYKVNVDPVFCVVYPWCRGRIITVKVNA